MAQASSTKAGLGLKIVPRSAEKSLVVKSISLDGRLQVKTDTIGAKGGTESAERKTIIRLGDTQR